MSASTDSDLTAFFTSPTKIIKQATINEIANGLYTFHFQPTEIGIHTVCVIHEDAHICGSPFQVDVTRLKTIYVPLVETVEPSPSEVSEREAGSSQERQSGKKDKTAVFSDCNDGSCTKLQTNQHGFDLKVKKSHSRTAEMEPIKTEPTDFIIDTINAGADTLKVTTDDSSKVTMDMTEVEKGYVMRYAPHTPEDFYISIKYNDNHICGSPIKISTAGASHMVDVDLQATSSVVAEAAAKVETAQGSALPAFQSNAAKVTYRGLELKKAFLKN